MLQTVVILTLAGALSQSPAATRPQATAPAETAPKAEPARAAEPPALPVNIKIEVSITDQTGTNPPAKKIVSMIAGDRQNTFIRSSASMPVRQVPTNNFISRNVTINVDARPTILQKEPTKIMLTFGLEYLPKTTSGQEEMEPGMATLNERLGLILESGKSMMVSQAADPTSDRKITVEVTATILK